MSSSRVFEKEIIDPIYSSDLFLYNRKVGNKEFKWHTIPSREQDPTSLNNVSRVLNFQDTLNSSYYDMRNAKMILSFKVVDATNDAALDIDAKVGLSSDTFIKHGRLSFGTSEIHNYGSKDALHRTAHIEKLLTYTPNHSKAIADHEHFYPDTGVIGGVNRVPFIHRAAILRFRSDILASGGVTNVDGTITSGGVIEDVVKLNNFISVGYGNSTALNNTTAGFPDPGTDPGTPIPVSLIDIARSDRPDGNTVFRTDYNPTFNEGFYDRESRSSKSKVITVTIPLRYYFKVLNAFPDAITGFIFNLQIQLPTNAEMLMSSSNVTNNSKIVISRAELRIPAYTPNELVQTEMIKRIKSEYTTIRRYVDWDYQVSSDLTAPATKTTVVFPVKIDKRPLAFLFGFQFNGEVDSQNGNCHRYFNPEVSSAQLSIGGTQIGANYMVGNAGLNDEQSYFEELMKVADIINTSDGVVLDWKAFHYHKFIIPFDVRDQLSEETITDIIIKSVPITFTAVHNQIETASVGSAISVYQPGGTYKVNMFALVERAIEVKMVLSGLSVIPNVTA